MNNNEKRTVFTVKNVLRALGVLCIIVVFCPSFLISCSGQEVKMSAMNTVTGIKSHGTSLVNPQPLLLILLILPAVSFAMLIIKSIEKKKASIIIVACTSVDLLIWLIFRAAVKSSAEENYCGFKTTGWFFLNVISLLLIIVLNILILTKRIDLETDLVAILTKGGTRDVLSQMSASVSQMSSAVSQMAGSMGANSQKTEIIGYCAKCGKGLEYDLKFCTNCGTPVPESLIAEAEEKRRLEEEARRREAERQAEIQQQANDAADSLGKNVDTGTVSCPYCGSVVDGDSAFCPICGNKI